MKCLASSHTGLCPFEGSKQKLFLLHGFPHIHSWININLFKLSSQGIRVHVIRGKATHRKNCTNFEKTGILNKLLFYLYFYFQQLKLLPFALTYLYDINSPISVFVCLFVAYTQQRTIVLFEIPLWFNVISTDCIYDTFLSTWC